MECHHIIPRCLGGDNSKENLIWLTKSEHVEAHRKLFLENPDSISMFCAYNAAVIFNKSVCSSDEIDSLLQMKVDFMRENNPMNNPKHRETLSKSKLGELNSACKPNQRVALYKDSDKSVIQKVFYSVREAAIYVSTNISKDKSWQSLAVCIRHACKNKIHHADNKYWGFISDIEYRQILIEGFNNEIL